MKKILPKFLQSILWSYPVKSLDQDKDREYVIAQVLNYGDWPAIKWLRKTYHNEVLKNAILHPRRGLWHERTLNFWEQMFKIKIDPEVRKRAIMDINPDYNYKLPFLK